LWLGAGLVDWYLHRRTRIEETAGPRESATPTGSPTRSASGSSKPTYCCA